MSEGNQEEQKLTAKNIIVCADGTGNKGGYSPDSNVYRIYKAIDKKYTGTIEQLDISEQIVFYDNGVGTEQNKLLRALGGGIGIGFELNVCDLYKYLARNYEPGDRIYFFGFSRGASTIRACNGMIYQCGLVKGKGLRNRELDALVKKAFDVYKVHKKSPALATALRDSDQSHGAVAIQFMGIWDTVVALGFPKRTDITGPLTYVLDKSFAALEMGLNAIWPHKFYHYQLTDNIKYACQALAIDDERTAFWPFVWDEHQRHPDSTVEQVWFAGMHSNVGGGYERSGMASVPLHWIMQQALDNGLKLQPEAVKKAENDSHIHGRMYNSRDGLAIIYRYHPRIMATLCENRLEDKIKIHSSVLSRMLHRTANYAPGFLPKEFQVVGDSEPVACDLSNDSQWLKIRSIIDELVQFRKRLYEGMIFVLLSIMLFYFFSGDSSSLTRTGISGSIAGFFDLILPDFLDDFINLALLKHPYETLAVTIILSLFMYLRNNVLLKMADARETLRHLIINKYNEKQKNSEEVS